MKVIAVIYNYFVLIKIDEDWFYKNWTILNLKVWIKIYEAQSLISIVE